MALSLQCLKKLWMDEMFSLFWCKVTDRASSLEMEEPNRPHRCKVPRRYEDGYAQATYPTTVEEYYRQIYYKALDLTIKSISDCFDQHSYHVYSQVEVVKLAKLVLVMPSTNSSCECSFGALRLIRTYKYLHSIQ